VHFPLNQQSLMIMAVLDLSCVVVPIIYQVHRACDGSSFATRKVEAKQKGLVIFTLIASFQKEEIGFEHQAAIMPDVPPPEQARISLFSSIWYMWNKEQTTNKQSNAAP